VSGTSVVLALVGLWLAAALWIVGWSLGYAPAEFPLLPGAVL